MKLPCLDSIEMGKSRQHELHVRRDVAAALGQSAVDASTTGYYLYGADRKIDWSQAVQAAFAAKLSIAPHTPLLAIASPTFTETRVQVTNETTLEASRRLVEARLKPLALSFANGVHPGGRFLNGARAQEEVLCRSSALL